METVVNIFLGLAVAYMGGGLFLAGVAIYRGIKEEQRRVLISNLKGEPQPPKAEHTDFTLMIFSLVLGVVALIFGLYGWT